MRQLIVALIIVFDANTVLDMVFLAVLFNLLFALMEILGRVDPQLVELHTRIDI